MNAIMPRLILLVALLSTACSLKCVFQFDRPNDLGATYDVSLILTEGSLDGATEQATHNQLNAALIGYRAIDRAANYQ